MKKHRINIPVSRLRINTGQVEGLPKNPRQWTQYDIDRTAKSIEEDPDFLEDRPLLVIADKGAFVVFAGNLRLTAAKKLDMKELPCVQYEPESEEDVQTIIRRAAKDNGSFGSWDYDELANSWGDYPLGDWGISGVMSEEIEEIPSNLDADKKEKDYVLKITFPDAGRMTEFVMAYKDVLEKDYGCIMSESGGAL